MQSLEWIIDAGTELLLKGTDDSLHNVPAIEIWESEETKQYDRLPALSSIGLHCSGRSYKLQLVIRPTSDGAFGQLKLEAFGSLGGRIELSDSHSSDHLVTNGAWHPIDEDSFKDVFNLVEEQKLSFGMPLTLAQFITLTRLAVTNDWIQSEVHPKAQDISEVAFAAQAYKESSSFTGSLYDYQQRGSAWMSFMLSQGTGLVLGDCMGLGKTIQVIRVICDMLQENSGARILIVCPSALLENWDREFKKFSRGVSVEKHSGPDRTGDYRKLKASVILTTYELVRLDRAVLGQITWDLVVLDEAQNIKNPRSQRTRAAKALPRKAGIVVTGTPFENHMTDLWSLFDFCVPSALGNLSQFRSTYKDDEYSAQQLGEITAPMMLRRSIEDASIELPDIVRIPMPIELDDEQAKLYERRREEYLTSGATLGAIQKLIRDLAFPSNTEHGISDLKYSYLEYVASEVFDANEKLLVFADRYCSIGAIQEMLGQMAPPFVLTGMDPVQDRQKIIDQFSTTEGAAFLVVNPTVGGAGLNITEANHVLHFSPQWNPAKIDQADARAYRHGQKKTVFTHYPYYASTIEEYMWEKIYFKRELSEQAVVGNKGELDANDIVQALEMSPIKGKVVNND